jgi:ribosome-associated translation inhibitor RaiA
VAAATPTGREVPVPELQISTRNLRLSPDQDAAIRRRVERLHHYYDRVGECRITIDVPQRRRRSDALRYGVRLVLSVPRGRIVVARQPRAQLRTALDEVFQAARRRLQDHARRLRGDVKKHSLVEVL